MKNWDSWGGCKAVSHSGGGICRGFARDLRDLQRTTGISELARELTLDTHRQSYRGAIDMGMVQGHSESQTSFVELFYEFSMKNWDSWGGWK